MKLSLFKKAVLLILVFVSAASFSQDFQGKAYYQTKTTMDMSQFGGRQASPDQIKRMEERMKSFLEKEYTLIFNKEESIYKEEERLEAGGGSGGRFGGFMSSFTGGPKYKNVKSKELLQDQEFFGKQFLIKDDLQPLEWKMGTETKQIGQYTCFKATATKPVTGASWQNMRRRNNDSQNKEQAKDSTNSKKPNNPIDEIEIPETIEVVAWYTPQIPINQGPDDYWGLPGLILEINADRTTILCTKIVMNPKEKDNIDRPKKGETVTQAEYTEITTKKMQEMRDSRGRGNRGRGRN
jgi:GLPGLI family protein